MHRCTALVLVLLAVGCGSTPETSEPPVGVPLPLQPTAPARSPWAIQVPRVEASPGNLAVVVKVSGPPSAPDPVWAGVTVEKPDGTFEDTPIVAIPRASLGKPVTLTHALGEGYTTFAIGVWKSDPPSCTGQPGCKGRLHALPDALAAWPSQPTAGGPVLDKIDRHLRVLFRDLSRSGTLSKAVRRTVATRLVWFYPGPTWTLSIQSDPTAGDPRPAILVRYRDATDGVAAEEVAVDLRKAVTGAGVLTEHATDLPAAFVIDMGGDVKLRDESTPSPTVVHRPGG